MRIYCIVPAAYHCCLDSGATINPQCTTIPAPAAAIKAAPAGSLLMLLMLLTLAIGFVMAMIDVTAVNTALTDIAFDLKVPLSGLIWVVDGYTLTFAALLLAGGALADRFGARNAYLGGLAVFLAGSVLCALAPGGYALVAARLLQGSGAALFMPSSLSLLTHAYEDDRVRARMVGTWSAVVGAASAAGPLLGGVLVHELGWRSVFRVNVPVGLLGMALAWTLIPATARYARPLSLLSHGLGVAGLAALSFVLIEGPSLGWLSVPVLSALACAVLFTTVLVRRERRSAHPMLPRALFATGSFAAANGTGFLINFAVFGQLLLLSMYLQQAGGLDALQTGLQLLPMMAAFTAGNLMSGRISARLGARVPLLGGLAAGAAMGVLLMGMGHCALWPVLLMNLSVGTAIPAMTLTVMQVAGKAHANSAAAALNANRQIGALVGVALMGTIMHAAPDWGLRLTLAFGAVALAYAAAWPLVFRCIHGGKPAPVHG